MIKSDFEIIETKLKALNKLQNEELQKVNREKTAADSQKKESEKLVIQEKEKVALLGKEQLKLKKNCNLRMLCRKNINCVGFQPTHLALSSLSFLLC